MPEVQAFSLTCSIDDAGLFGKIIWLDFSSLEDTCAGTPPEVEETVEIIKIDIKKRT